MAWVAELRLVNLGLTFHLMAHGPINRENCDIEVLWKDLVSYAFAKHLGLVVRAQVLMSNHLHGIFESECEEFNFEAAIEALSGFGFSRDLISFEFISCFAQYAETYRYIYRNPVNAKLCEKVEEYRYSTLRGVIGKSKNEFYCCDNLGVVQNPRILKWLNGECELYYRRFQPTTRPPSK